MKQIFPDSHRYPVTGETLNMLTELVDLLRDGSPLDPMYQSTTARALEDAVTGAAAAPLEDLAETLDAIVADMGMPVFTDADGELIGPVAPALWSPLLESIVKQLREGPPPRVQVSANAWREMPAKLAQVTEQIRKITDDLQAKDRRPGVIPSPPARMNGSTLGKRIQSGR